MLKINLPNNYYTPRQLKLPLEIEKLIDVSDSVYTFCEVMDHIDLSGYFVAKEYKTGRPGCDKQKLLKVILFAFMENGYCSLRELEKLCRNDIRYMYLLDGMKAPSFATPGIIFVCLFFLYMFQKKFYHKKGHETALMPTSIIFRVSFSAQVKNQFLCSKMYPPGLFLCAHPCTHLR